MCFPHYLSMVVLINEDYASFAAEKWLVPALPSLMNNADGVIFATQAEIAQVAAFFTKSAASEAVEQLVAMQLVPFPRLHFFTLSTALGQELRDGEVPTYRKFRDFCKHPLVSIVRFVFEFSILLICASEGNIHIHEN